MFNCSFFTLIKTPAPNLTFMAMRYFFNFTIWLLRNMNTCIMLLLLWPRYYYYLCKVKINVLYCSWLVGYLYLNHSSDVLNIDLRLIALTWAFYFANINYFTKIKYTYIHFATIPRLIKWTFWWFILIILMIQWFNIPLNSKLCIFLNYKLVWIK